MMESHPPQVVIIGAGPYGLAAAAHLRSAGVETCVFGRTMEFWRSQMPRGMLLRSSWEASHIADPQNAFTLDEYKKTHNKTLPVPVPLDDFIEYGEWFQKQVAPDVDPRRVTRIDREGNGFRVALDDGETLHAPHVIVGAGIAPFAYRPSEFRDLPPSLASHSSENQDLHRFSGQKVLVVGGGQSALESAVLLCEAGAEVQVMVRANQIHWLRGRNWVFTHAPGFIQELLYHKTDVGPPVLNQIVARPEVFRRFPPSLQERIAYRSIRPAGAGWLIPRAGKVKISTGHWVVSAAASGEGVLVTLEDGSQQYFDHVLLATGYRVDISRYGFLSPQLLQSIERINGYPVLSPGIESSVPGLYFIGAPAARSFGPLTRFVSGTGYAGRAVTKSITGKFSKTYRH